MEEDRVEVEGRLAAARGSVARLLGDDAESCLGPAVTAFNLDDVDAY